MHLFKLEIITPEKVVYQSEVESIVIPASDGRMGILAGHVPGVVGLEPGIADIRDGNRETQTYVLTGGYAEITKTGVNLLVESAEKPDQVDLKASKKAVDEARKIIDDPASTSDQILQAKHSMEKELGRVKALSFISHRG